MSQQHELVDHMFDILLINETSRDRREVEQEKDEGHGEDEDEEPQ